jgi:glycosyltransferase involved in cell wall biosynthesis
MILKYKTKAEPRDSLSFSNGQHVKLHVCFVGCYPPTRGRLAEHSYYLIEELHRLPEIERIEVITDRPELYKTKRINSKITVYRTWDVDNLVSLLSIPLKVSRLKPDVIHFNVHMAVFGRSRLANFIGLSLPFVCRLMGFKTIVSLHNITETIDVEKAGFHNTSLNRLGAFIAIKLLTLGSVVTLTVRSYLRVLESRYKCRKALWIPHGTWETRNNGGNNHLDPKKILYIGHTGPYKDLELLFEAFERIRRRRENVKLIVAGASHPNYPGFLEKFKSENSWHNVEFLGYVPDDLLLPLFDKVSAVILPYHTCTGTSGVAHLASSYGVPIIATDLPEFRELADEGCGIVLCPHDPESLAEKIVMVLDDPDLAGRLMRQSLLFARKRTWDKIARSYCQVYEQI